MPLSERIGRVLRSTAPSRPVAVARVIVGAAAIAKAAYYASTVLPRLGPDTIRVPWFEAIPPLSPPFLSAILLAWSGAAAAFLVGYRTRIAGSVLLTSATALLLADRQLYSNHLYLLLTLVLLLTIARSADDLALDARSAGGSARVPGWPVFLLKLQLTIVYTFSVAAKANLDFISGSVIFLNWRNSGAVPLPASLGRLEVMMGLAILVMLGELYVAIGFWSKRLVRSCVAVGVLLHVGMVLTTGGVWELSIFAALMFSMYVLFLTPASAAEPARREAWMTVAAHAAPSTS